MPIESRANPRIRTYRSLAEAKGRREHGLFQLEGASLIAEAVAAGVTLHAAYWCPERAHGERERDLVAALQERTEVFQVSERVLTHMASTVTPQGILAEAPVPHVGLGDLRLPTEALILAPAQAQDPGNMGTMIRTAHAVGAAAVVAIGECVDPYGPKVVRATMGSLLRLPVVRDAPPAEFLAWCAAQRLEVVAATVQGPGRLFEAPLSPRTAILLGSESRGLPPELLTAQVRGVAIPMPGGTESLNVAVAAAVLMYDYRRQHPIRGASPEA